MLRLTKLCQAPTPPSFAGNPGPTRFVEIGADYRIANKT